MSPSRIHRFWPTVAAALALIAVFMGERMFVFADTLRTAFAVVALALMAGSIVARLNEFLSAPEPKKPVLKLLFGSTVGLAVGLGLYALIPLVFDGDSTFAERFRGVLWALWPIVTLVSLLVLIKVEAAVMPVAFIERYERVRVHRSATRGAALGLLLSCLFVGNYVVKENDYKWDLSSGLRTAAGPQTLQAVAELTKPVEVLLFFPRANEVADTVVRYLEPLVEQNSLLSIRRVDHALAGKLAGEVKVTENGYVVLKRDNVNEKIRLGTKERSARPSLRRLDGNFLKALLKVASDPKIAYFIGGHAERATSTPDKDDAREPLKIIRQALEGSQFQVKDLSLATGLGEKVPDDASIVFLMGPEKPLLPSEAQALLEATNHGVRLFIAMEGERDGEALANLLGPLGLRFDPTLLANERAHAQMTRTEADRRLIYSFKFTSHPSVSTMSRNPRRLAVVLSGAGSLEVVKDGTLERTKAEIVMSSIEDTFQDVDGNLTQNKQKEPSKVFGLAAAVVRTSTTAKREDESRIFVLGDVDVLGDELLKSIEGNGFLFRDAVLWLQREPSVIAPTVSEEDVKIVHKKDEDAQYFYGTTFGLPILVLGVGAIATRRRRRR